MAAAIAPPLALGDQQSSAATALPSPFVILTATALSYSWKYLIPSFGLTLLYLNLHFLGRYFAHSTKAFSRFGYGLFGKPPKPPNIAAEYAEIIALLILDALAAFLILLVITLVTIAAWTITNPEEVAAALGSDFVSIFTQ